MNLENFTNNYISLSQGGTSARLINQNGLIIIPVVVHILYNTNDQNISDAQIQSQIDVLNRDYRRLNPDAVNTPARFTNRATDYGIEFRLACIDPQGNFTNGIIRKYTSKTIFNTNYKRSDGTYNEEAIGIKTATTGSTAWPTDRYLNIWVCSLTSLLGYSTIPADFSVYPEYDGVVIRTTAFGTTGYVAAPYNLGRTSTHEIGHWLNLRHIWGDNYCGNDFVDDTPTQGNFTSGCPIDVRASCNNGPDGDMYMNYMDYTNDACMNLFTNGQRIRSRAVFATVNGVAGPRVSQLNNFFAIQSPLTTVDCATGIRLFNPCCLTPTWSVISGPASISTGQGTNEITLQISGNGTVVLRATAGNYVSDINISVTTNVPNLSISGPASACNNRPSYYTINLPTGGGVIWSSSPSGKVSLTAAGPNGILATPINSPTGSYTLIGTVTSSCGTTPVQLPVTFNTTPPPYNCYQVGNGQCIKYIYMCTEEFYAGGTYDIPHAPSDVPYWHWTVQGGHFTNGSSSQIVPYVPIYVKPDWPNTVCSFTISPMNECMVESTNEPFRYILVNTGQHCSGYYYMMSPNPASSEITISTINNSSETNVDRSITAVNIYSQEGNLKKQKKFGKVKTASMPVSDLINGMYVVEIVSGDYKEQKQLVVQH